MRDINHKLLMPIGVICSLALVFTACGRQPETEGPVTTSQAFVEATEMPGKVIVETDTRPLVNVVEKILGDISYTEGSVEDFYWDEAAGGLTIAYYIGADANVAIPETLAAQKVIAIAGNAFAASGVENILVPEGVTTIAENAFADVEGLESVSLPTSVVNLDGDIFGGRTDIAIISPVGSTSYNYAVENGIPVSSK